MVVALFAGVIVDDLESYYSWTILCHNSFVSEVCPSLTYSKLVENWLTLFVVV